MALAVPTKLEERLVMTLDRLVADGLYQSRSEAIRDAVRRLVERSYVSRTRFLRVIAEVTAHVILVEYSNVVTDIILYGSVASGQASHESDVDILVLVSGKREESPSQLEVDIHEMTYPIALASESVITPIVLEKRTFVDLAESGEHFAKEILMNGVQLYGTTLNELRKQRLFSKG